MNLVQIRSAVPEIFSYTNKKPQTDGAKNRTLHSSLRAVATHGYKESAIKRPQGVVTLLKQTNMLKNRTFI